MTITRRPHFRYPHTSFLAIVLALSLTVIAGLAAQAKSDTTASIVDLLATCDQCAPTQISAPNSPLN